MKKSLKMKRKIIKRKISKIKKKNPKEPHYMRSVDLSGREENDGITQLNIDMGDDFHSATRKDFEKLKKNYQKCPNRFLDDLHDKFVYNYIKKHDPIDRQQRYKLMNEASEIFNYKFKSMMHVKNYCSDPKCLTCEILRKANEAENFTY